MKAKHSFEMDINSPFKPLHFEKTKYLVNIGRRSHDSQTMTHNNGGLY